MRRTTKPIGFAACLSMLVLQLGGVHLHVDEGGLVGAPETAYSHSHAGHDHAGAPRPQAHGGPHGQAGHDGHAGRHDASELGGPAHDYGGARDVSLLDQALAVSKILPGMPAPGWLFAALPRAPTFAGTDVAYPVLSGRHTRWRPPLRAPPIPA